jgi:hypothetical protein
LSDPPYEREPNDPGAEHKGGWVRDGWGGWRGGRAPLEDYLEPARLAGAGGHLKNIYNLYVYFWRWAVWRVLERYEAPGIAALITASSYLRGPGFIGLRRQWRQSATLIRILDLEGDQKGARKTENVFNILIPVAIATLARKPIRWDLASSWHGKYYRVTGSKEEKLSACREYSQLLEVPWQEFSSEDSAPFIPGGVSGYGYADWPRVTDLFPWQHSGAQFKRKWPIASAKATLVARWHALLAASNRIEAYRETRDRKVQSRYPHLIFDDQRDPAVGTLPIRAEMPPVHRYGYRSFDRQWCIADSRLGDFIRPPLWRTMSDVQVFIVSLLTKVLGAGPCAIASSVVPDLDYFCNRGGKDVIPLWRKPEATEANVCKEAMTAIYEIHGSMRDPADLFAYTYTILANPGYVQRFEEELQVPGPRLPITKDRELFNRGAKLGRELIRLHTYGERFREEGDGFELKGSACVIESIPARMEAYPECYHYDENKQLLNVGAGSIGPVSPEVWAFSVSGLQVVKSWLDYRKKNGAGRTSSPLDDIRPESWTEEMTRELLELLWVLEMTLQRYPELDEFLDAVLDSEIFTEDELPKPTDAERKEPTIIRRKQGRLI